MTARAVQAINKEVSVHHVRCVSPVDGRVYVERVAASEAHIQGSLKAARAAQAEWRRLSVDERAGYCLAAVEAMLKRLKGDGRPL